MTVPPPASTGPTVRDTETVEAVREFLPGSLDPVFVLVTHLGDPIVLVGLATAAYWLAPRRGLLDRGDAARFLALTVGAYALVIALKAWFDLPRPPGSLQVGSPGGHGFPSGHATMATVAYGGLAALLDRWSRRRRLLAGGALAAAVAASRVLIGVHFPADVVAGVLVGSAFLGVGLLLGRDAPVRAAGLAALSGVAAAGLAWPTHDAGTALGGTVGVAAAWVLLRHRVRSPGRTVRGVSPPLAGAGLVAMGLLSGAVWLARPVPLLALVTYGALGAMAVALPVVGPRLREKTAATVG